MHSKKVCTVQFSHTVTPPTLFTRLQDLWNATASFHESAARDQSVMADGNSSGVSPKTPARKASAVESSATIAGIVIGAALALAVLVVLLILMCRKRHSSRSAQLPDKVIVRFGSWFRSQNPDESFFILSSA
jgi:beta-lactamase regulating signal transducer with metallopeptidase domain